MTEPSASASRPVRFGVFELDPRSGELRNNGSRVTLPDQPLQLLLALLEQRGELVSRDELRRRLWPGDTFVDFEHGLNAAVKRLRDALGDSADHPRFIETLPRRGYRFIAPIDRPGVGQDTDAAPVVTAGPGGSRPADLAATTSDEAATKVDNAVKNAGEGVRRNTGWRRTPLLLALGLLAAAIAAWWVVSRRSADSGAAAPPPVAIERELTRLTFGSGLQTDVTWSPDGQRIAYASDQTGNFDVWLQPVGGGDPTPLTTSPAADSQPAWSPDGERIVFRSERDGGGLFVVSTRGGPVRRLTTFGVRPIWWSGGRQVLFRRGLESPFSSLYTVSASGDDQPRAILADLLTGGSFRMAGAASGWEADPDRPAPHASVRRLHHQR